VVFLLKGLAEIVTVVHVVACVSAWLLVELSAHESEAIRITVEIYNKTATRLPEALWIDFNPWTTRPPPISQVISLTLTLLLRGLVVCMTCFCCRDGGVRDHYCQGGAWKSCRVMCPLMMWW